MELFPWSGTSLLWQKGTLRLIKSWIQIFHAVDSNPGSAQHPPVVLVPLGGDALDTTAVTILQGSSSSPWSVGLVPEGHSRLFWEMLTYNLLTGGKYMLGYRSPAFADWLTVCREWLTPCLADSNSREGWGSSSLPSPQPSTHPAHVLISRNGGLFTLEQMNTAHLLGAFHMLVLVRNTNKSHMFPVFLIQKEHMKPKHIWNKPEWKVLHKLL